jgi:1-acyl-sn-glycerol-3-phosphate acyltransferase
MWSPIGTCTTQMCLSGADAAAQAGPLRRLGRWALFTAALLVGVVLAAPVRLCCRPQRRDALIRWWVRAAVAALGVSLRIHRRGAAARGGVLVVSNHVSWLDILLIAAVRPGRMLAKREVRDWPVVGWLAARGGTLFIDRERLRQLPGTVARIADALRDGRTVVAFPEGSTWCGRDTGRYRPAVFQAALDAGAAVQPVTLRYRTLDGRPSTVPAYVGDDTLIASLRRIVAARDLVAEVTVRPAIPPGALPCRRGLAATAETTSVRCAAPGCAAPALARPQAGTADGGFHRNAVRCLAVPQTA